MNLFEPADIYDGFPRDSWVARGVAETLASWRFLRGRDRAYVTITSATGRARTAAISGRPRLPRGPVWPPATASQQIVRRTPLRTDYVDYYLLHIADLGHTASRHCSEPPTVECVTGKGRHWILQLDARVRERVHPLQTCGPGRGLCRPAGEWRTLLRLAGTGRGVRLPAALPRAHGITSYRPRRAAC